MARVGAWDKRKVNSFNKLPKYHKNYKCLVVEYEREVIRLLIDVDIVTGFSGTP